MNVVKGKLITPSVLALPRSNVKYTIDSDACDTQVGYDLLQKKDDKILKSIKYWSRSLCDAKRRYDMTHKDCLVVVWVVLTLKPYLEGSHFLIRADHWGLQRILDL